jgi:fumarylacetoacetate (FAA) hydrolase
MKLASLKSGDRDGCLVVVNRSLTQFTRVPGVARSLQAALDDWDRCAPQLEKIYHALNDDQLSDKEAFDTRLLRAPLPRAYQWLDASAYLSHVERVRKARGAPMPDSFQTDPLMYQGGSDTLLGPNEPIAVADEQWGIDLEAEVAVITDAVPPGITPQQSLQHIKLLTLVNDVSLRNLVAAELAKGFGFLHAKPPTAFAPVAITPDELGEAWHEAKVHLPLVSYVNGKCLGEPDAGVDMQFDFARLIAHAAKTRPLGAGTIIGSGTVSNHDQSKGCSCLVEKRVLEIIEHGQTRTAFLHYGDRVRIEMLNAQGESLFGAIEQTVAPITELGNHSWNP